MKLLLMQLPTNQSRHTEFMTMFMYDLIYDVAYFGKFSNFGKEKDFIKGKNTLSMITSSGPTASLFLRFFLKE